jgi:hypothetical protein
LNYYWGVTYENGKDGQASKENKFYTFIQAGINPKNKYWVETWYSSNKFCRNRTNLDLKSFKQE